MRHPSLIPCARPADRAPGTPRTPRRARTVGLSTNTAVIRIKRSPGVQGGAGHEGSAMISLEQEHLGLVAVNRGRTNNEDGGRKVDGNRCERRSCGHRLRVPVRSAAHLSP